MNTDVSDTPNIDALSIPIYEDEAQKIIRNYTIVATGSGLIPIPVISGGLVTGAQVLMIRDLCELFNIHFNEEINKVIINSTVGSIISKVLTAGLAMIPGTAGPIKGLTDAGIAGLYTATVGEYYKVHFQHGGNLENASLKDLGNYFISEVRKGDISLNTLTSPAEMVKRMLG